MANNIVGILIVGGAIYLLLKPKSRVGYGCEVLEAYLNIGDTLSFGEYIQGKVVVRNNSEKTQNVFVGYTLRLPDWNISLNLSVSGQPTYTGGKLAIKSGETVVIEVRKFWTDGEKGQAVEESVYAIYEYTNIGDGPFYERRTPNRAIIV